jgi:hypothetical protein
MEPEIEDLAEERIETSIGTEQSEDEEEALKRIFLKLTDDDHKEFKEYLQGLNKSETDLSIPNSDSENLPIDDKEIDPSLEPTSPKTKNSGAEKISFLRKICNLFYGIFSKICQWVGSLSSHIWQVLTGSHTKTTPVQVPGY